MTVSDILKQTKNALKAKDIETVNLDASLIVMKAMGFTKLQLITKDDSVLSGKQEQAVREMLERRLSFEPMQYILGECEFMGLDFKVNENVLIPRPETETVCEEALSVIKSKGYVSVLDLCCGSGAIGISISHYTGIKVSLSDISDKALEVAFENKELNKADVELIQSDLFENITEKYDIIISNPPYIEREVIRTLSPQVKNYEPMLALDGGEDGLDYYRDIISEAYEYLTEGGCLLFEIGYNQKDSVTELFEKKGYKNISSGKDLAGLDRFVYGFKWQNTQKNA